VGSVWFMTQLQAVREAIWPIYRQLGILPAEVVVAAMSETSAAD